MDIQEIIDRYGSQLSHSLQVSTNKLYPKLLWYVRMNGLIGLINPMVFLISAGIGSCLIHAFCKKNKIYEYRDTDLTLAVWVLGFVFVVLFTLVIVCGLIPNIIKMVAPQYWIIQQIINKVK